MGQDCTLPFRMLEVPIHEAALSSTATHFCMLRRHAPGGTTFRPLDPLSRQLAES